MSKLPIANKLTNSLLFVATFNWLTVNGTFRLHTELLLLKRIHLKFLTVDPVLLDMSHWNEFTEGVHEGLIHHIQQISLFSIIVTNTQLVVWTQNHGHID